MERCVYLLESPHWGDSNEYTQHIYMINYEKKQQKNKNKKKTKKTNIPK